MIPSRRHFLLLAACAGGSCSLAATAWLLRRNTDTVARGLSGDAPPDGLYADGVSGSRLQTAVRSGRALGSQVTIKALHPRAERAEAAVTAAFAELEQVEDVMSIYRPESQLSRLNRDGVFRGPHPYLVEVLRRARAMSCRTSGAFDVTVQPLWRLYADAQRRGDLPQPPEVEAARQRVDYRCVDISARRIVLRQPGTEITLNGIAQGYAADRALAALRAHGVRHALVDTGELGAIGRTVSGDDWTVGIQHPRRADAYVSLAKLAGRCLATSGDYATTFANDFRYNHLFDPRTGKSPCELSSVSIVADAATDADAMSTAIFVLGAERGLQLIEEVPGSDGLLITREGRMLATSGFPLVDPSAVELFQRSTRVAGGPVRQS